MEDPEEEVASIKDQNLLMSCKVQLCHVRWTISRCRAKITKRFTSTRLIGVHSSMNQIGGNLKLFLGWEINLNNYSEEKNHISDVKIIYFQWKMQGKFRIFFFFMNFWWVFHGKIFIIPFQFLNFNLLTNNMIDLSLTSKQVLIKGNMKSDWPITLS